MARVSRYLVLLALGTLTCAAAVGGCGSRHEDASVPSDRVVMREYEFQPKSVTVKRGSTLAVENRGKIAHNLTIASNQDPLERPQKLIATDTFLGGRTKYLQIDLAPGRYLMICTIPGHRQLGMYGHLTVRER